MPKGHHTFFVLTDYFDLAATLVSSYPNSKNTSCAQSDCRLCAWRKLNFNHPTSNPITDAFSSFFPIRISTSLAEQETEKQNKMVSFTVENRCAASLTATVDWPTQQVQIQHDKVGL